MFAKHLNIDHPFVDVAKLDRTKQAFDAVDDLQSSTVTQRQNQRDSTIVRRRFNRFVKLFLANVGQIGQSPSPDGQATQIRRPATLAASMVDEISKWAADEKAQEAEA